MTLMLQFLYAFFACLGFCFMFNLKDRTVAAVSCLCGGFGWIVYLLVRPYVSVIVANLISAVFIAAFSEVAARRMSVPSTIFLIIGILPLVPGGGIYYTMEYCIRGMTDAFIEKGLETFGIAGAIAIGVSLVSSIVRIISSYTRRREI